MRFLRFSSSSRFIRRAVVLGVFFFFSTSAAVSGEVSKVFDSKQFLFSGRWDHAAEYSRTSAPAAMVQFNATASSLEIELEGMARWRLDQDGKTLEVFVSDKKAVKRIKLAGDKRSHKYRLIKISESNPGGAILHRISLDAKGSFQEPPKFANRRIEFIGDSFTVGYGVEGDVNDQEDHVFETTNASKSYAFLLADGYKADFQVNAFSGRGLVRNYDNIVPEWKIPRLYKFTVPGFAPEDVTKTAENPSMYWDFEQFHPQVIVVFVGINDFQGNPPYGDKDDFKKVYREMLNDLRSKHPGVKFLLVSTRIWPNDDLTPVVKSVFEDEKAAGNADLEFVEVHTENKGLHGHPTERSQSDLAGTLRPIIGRLGKWMSR